MKKLVMGAAVASAFLVGGTAHATHWDVIATELTGACTFAEYMEIVDDFNAWGADYGYQARIAVPLQSDNLTTLFWIGESADAATFGAAWDAWRDGQADPSSGPATLQARFNECNVNAQRTGYDVY